MQHPGAAWGRPLLHVPGVEALAAPPGHTVYRCEACRRVCQHLWKAACRQRADRLLGEKTDSLCLASPWLFGKQGFLCPAALPCHPAAARGLNGLAGPGNEIECELVTWTRPEQRHFSSGAADSSSSGSGSAGGSFSATSFSGLPGVASTGLGAGHSEPLKWARVVWRRGTVPIWWGVQLQSLAQVGRAGARGACRAGGSGQAQHVACCM